MSHFSRKWFIVLYPGARQSSSRILCPKYIIIPFLLKTYKNTCAWYNTKKEKYYYYICEKIRLEYKPFFERKSIKEGAMKVKVVSRKRHFLKDLKAIMKNHLCQYVWKDTSQFLVIPKQFWQVWQKWSCNSWKCTML